MSTKRFVRSASYFIILLNALCASVSLARGIHTLFAQQPIGEVAGSSSYSGVAGGGVGPGAALNANGATYPQPRAFAGPMFGAGGAMMQQSSMFPGSVSNTYRSAYRQPAAFTGQMFNTSSAISRQSSMFPSSALNERGTIIGQANVGSWSAFYQNASWNGQIGTGAGAGTNAAGTGGTPTVPGRTVANPLLQPSPRLWYNSAWGNYNAGNPNTP
jgi:hypothetical protein